MQDSYECKVLMTVRHILLYDSDECKALRIVRP